MPLGSVANDRLRHMLILNHTGAIECLVGAARVASFHCRQSSAMMRHADDVTLDPPGTPDRPAATGAHPTPTGR